MSSGTSELRLPSWQKPNCFRHASHPDILQELLYSFQGIDGTIVKFDKETGYTIRNDVCFERSHIVYQLLELGFLFYSVQRMLDSQTECMVSRGLASVVRDKLNEYYKHIADLQAESKPVEGVDIAILTHLLPWARQKMLVLQFIITILEETKGKIGGAVLNPIVQHLPHGNKILHENFVDLLDGTSVPLYQMIWYWVVMGTLKDPFNEFFVTENIEHSKTKAWQCQFSLKRQLLPYLFHGPSSKLILNIGKSMHFINKFCPEMALRFASYKKEIFPVDDSNLYSLIGDNGHPALRLKRIQMESSETLLHIMKSKYDLKEFFIHLHEYIFLMRGHFARYFMELVYPFLNCSVSEISLLQVKKLLHTAIEASSPSNDCNSILDNIQVSYNEETENDTVGEAIVLQCKMEGPIKTMFQIFDLSYRKLFTFLWQKNRAIYTTSRTWKLTRTLLKSCDLLDGVRARLLNLFTNNFHLMQILYQLDFYILYEVIEKNALEFFRRFESCRNIDETVQFHAKMLRSILCGILLEPEYEDLRAQISNIFSLVNEIEEVFSSLLADVENIGKGKMDESEEIIVNAKIEMLSRNNEAAIKNLAQFLKGGRHTDGLNTVCDRMDFNKFYGFD